MSNSNNNQRSPQKNQISLEKLDTRKVGDLVAKVRTFLARDENHISIDSMDDAYAICEVLKQIYSTEKNELAKTFQELSEKMANLEETYRKLQDANNNLSESGMNQSVELAYEVESNRNQSPVHLKAKVNIEKIGESRNKNGLEENKSTKKGEGTKKLRDYFLGDQVESKHSQSIDLRKSDGQIAKDLIKIPNLSKSPKRNNQIN